MKLPISWLKDYVDIEVSIEELESKLFSSGFEVEEVKYLGEEITNCVVGEITSLEKHQDSDHLQICKLNCGKFGGDIQIVTGAQNVFVGAKVPVALDGSTLHGGIKIKSGKLRGVVSNGMLCSGEELGITEEFFEGAGVNGILILPNDTQIGQDIKEVVGLNDYVFDISITANRPDCQSVFGMAREVSAILKKPLKSPAVFYVENDKHEHELTVEVKNNEVCPRYMATVVDEVKIEKSPRWLRQRLIKCDINAINNIVDITNYVLLELGQPMHAFDLKQLTNNEIIVRNATDGEKIKTLDEKEFELKENNLVIADAVKPVALAGIMGGFSSGVSEKTTEIVFESAVFIRESVRKTSRALGQASDSSHRFEKGVDAYTTELAMKRALNLIGGLQAGNITSMKFDFYKDKDKKPTEIATTYDAINKILGINVPKETIYSILQRLNFKMLSNINKEELVVECPPYRNDIDGTADLAEEVIRIYGYSHIIPRVLTTTQITKGGLTEYQKSKFRAKNALVNQGFSEIVTYSFYGEKDLDLFRIPKDASERNFIKLQNPLTEDIEIMKTILAPSTLSIINKNIKKGVESASFFELANVYIPKELPLVNFPNEKPTLSLGTYGENENFFTLKGTIEALASVFGFELSFENAQKSFLHPYRSANILANNEVIGFIGQIAYEITADLSLEKDIFIAELDFDKFLANEKDYSYKLVSKHPEIKRDLALVVRKEILSGEVEKVIKETSKKVSKVELFDVYEGNQIAENFKSFAYHITFTPNEEPITHEEVDSQIKKILFKLNEKLGCILR